MCVTPTSSEQPKYIHHHMEIQACLVQLANYSTRGLQSGTQHTLLLHVLVERAADTSIKHERENEVNQ
jgi:hypothetical protein